MLACVASFLLLLMCVLVNSVDEDVLLFFVHPRGQHARYPTGADETADGGAQGASCLIDHVTKRRNGGKHCRTHAPG
jgi:hypothetical protein